MDFEDEDEEEMECELVSEPAQKLEPKLPSIKLADKSPDSPPSDLLKLSERNRSTRDTTPDDAITPGDEVHNFTFSFNSKPLKA